MIESQPSETTGAKSEDINILVRQRSSHLVRPHQPESSISFCRSRRQERGGAQERGIEWKFTDRVTQDTMPYSRRI
jgi:hypothetical protein